MLELISLGIIDKIFNGKNINAHAKMFYINCLIYHFRELEPIIDNSNAFSIDKKTIQYNKFKEIIRILENNELIEINNDSILFYNKWSKYININLYYSKEQDILKDIDSFKNELISNESLLNVVAMQNSIKKELANGLLETFIAEQKVTDKRYYSYSDVSRHFIAWAKKGKDDYIKNTRKNKSNGKLLG